MKKVIVLGGGMVGSAMAIDLARDYDVTIADKDALTLKKLTEKHEQLKTLSIDITDHASLKKAISKYDLVVCAVPGFLGYNTLKAIIEAGKNVVDISFFPENALELDELAKDKKVTAVVDCGVAPGMGNIILGYYDEKMKVKNFECLVGGLPKVKKWPFYYKAPFSPIDVIEEYTRPARYVENGQLIVKEALSDCDYVEFERIGTLESFNSDGLRSLIFTMSHIPNMKEKTLRYPGHVEYINVLKKSGFFNKKKIKIGDKEVSPLDFTSRILFDEWKLGENEEELTAMRISISDGRQHIVYHLYDEYDHKTNTSSMARTTGYTATAVANLILSGQLTDKGILPPELVGKIEVHFKYILQYLEERGVKYVKEIKF